VKFPKGTGVVVDWQRASKRLGFGGLGRTKFPNSLESRIPPFSLVEFQGNGFSEEKERVQKGFFQILWGMKEV